MPRLAFRCVSLTFALLLGVGPTAAEENWIAIGYGEGTVGTRNVIVPVLVRHAAPIQGYSLSIEYPSSAIRLIEISSRGTVAQQIGTDFYQQQIDEATGTATLGVIFAFSDPYLPAELPPTDPAGWPQLLAWLVFDIKSNGPAGEHPLRLANGHGDPPISNRFTSRGTTIRPTLRHGSFLVVSDDVLTIGSKFAFPGARINALYTYARHARPLEGFQFAMKFDPSRLTLTDATYNGTEFLFALGSTSKIEFSLITWKANEITVSPTEARMTAGFIFDYLAPYNPNQVLPPETNSTTTQSLLKFAFQVKDGADLGADYLPLELDDKPTPGFINNVFLADSQSFTPRRVDGRIYFSTGFVSGKVVEFGTGKVLSGARILAEPGSFTGTTGTDGKFMLGGTDGLPPGPYALSVSKSGYYTGQLRGNAPGQGAAGDLGVVALFPVAPSTGGFRRGAINADRSIDISDAIFYLSYIFLGGEAPQCNDSADVNDDGELDLSDGIALLGFVFLGGRPPPPPLADCGEDTTADSLGCKLFTGC